MRDIFLSYASEDRTKARTLADLFEECRRATSTDLGRSDTGRQRRAYWKSRGMTSFQAFSRTSTPSFNRRRTLS